MPDNTTPTPDHRAVTLEFKLRKKSRENGYWKLNNSILLDAMYKGISDLINEILDQYSEDVSKHLMWEYMKIRIKEFTISFFVKKSKITKCQIKELEEKLNKLNQINNEEDKITRKLLKQQLDKLYDQKTLGYHIRSRAKWVEEGEKSTKYF